MEPTLSGGVIIELADSCVPFVTSQRAEVHDNTQTVWEVEQAEVSDVFVTLRLLTF